MVAQLGQRDLLDGADQTDNVQVSVSLGFLTVDTASLAELFDQRGPLAAEDVGTSEGTVTTADGETVDTKLDEVLGSLQTAFTGADYTSVPYSDHCLAPGRQEGMR